MGQPWDPAEGELGEQTLRVHPLPSPPLPRANGTRYQKTGDPLHGPCWSRRWHGEAWGGVERVTSQISVMLGRLPEGWKAKGTEVMGPTCVPKQGTGAPPHGQCPSLWFHTVQLDAAAHMEWKRKEIDYPATSNPPRGRGAF